MHSVMLFGKLLLSSRLGSHAQEVGDILVHKNVTWEANPMPFTSPELWYYRTKGLCLFYFNKSHNTLFPTSESTNTNIKRLWFKSDISRLFSTKTTWCTLQILAS